MDHSDFVDAQGTTWRIFAGLPADWPDTGEQPGSGAHAGLTFRAGTGEVRVLPQAVIPRRVSTSSLTVSLGSKQPVHTPDTPDWEELLRLAVPWSAA
jgi:hypothetical protein